MNIRGTPLHALAIVGVVVCAVAALAACAGVTPATPKKVPLYPPGLSSDVRIISDFHSWFDVAGERRNLIHQGIDVAGPSGQSVIAVADGKVVETHTDECWGPTIAIDHGNIRTGRRLIALYGHVHDILVEEGQAVSRGDEIALLGDNQDDYDCIAGVRHLHLQLGSRRQLEKGSHTSHNYFLEDGEVAMSPHRLWADGPYKITCFRKGRDYPKGTITYPMPCGG